MGKAGEEGVLAKDVRHSETNASRVGSPKPVLDAEHPDPKHGVNEVEMEVEEEVASRRWSGQGQKIDMQTIEADMMEEEGWGEGGEVGDGGGVLRRLDPALCMSVRARKWLEGLEWRKEVLDG